MSFNGLIGVVLLVVTYRCAKVNFCFAGTSNFASDKLLMCFRGSGASLVDKMRVTAGDSWPVDRGAIEPF